MWSGPGFRSGHLPICPLYDVYMSLTFVEETSRYVPSNDAPADEDDGACAFAAASKPKNPIIDKSPICLRMRLSSSRPRPGCRTIAQPSSRGIVRHKKLKNN